MPRRFPFRDGEGVFEGLTADERFIVETELSMPQAQDVETLTRAWAEDIVYYDFGPRRHDDKDAAVAEIAAQFHRVVNVRTQILELTVESSATMGYAFSLQNFIADRPDGGDELNFVFRKTDAYEKRDAQWRLMHQHLSVPTDLTAGTVTLVSEISTAT